MFIGFKETKFTLMFGTCKLTSTRFGFNSMREVWLTLDFHYLNILLNNHENTKAQHLCL